MVEPGDGGRGDSRESLLEPAEGHAQRSGYSTFTRSDGIFNRVFGSRVDAARNDNHTEAYSKSNSFLNIFGRRHGGGSAGMEESKSESLAATPAPSREASKLGTFTGVFVPTVLNVLSILMFIRFGLILGQAGFVGTLGMLICCYIVNTLTTMSVSAIASNGTVRGGGPYYLISRSLGPEFGGSIGIVLYLGYVLNTGMNAVGLTDSFVQNFGRDGGNRGNWLPDSYWYRYLWSSSILLTCTIICLAGSGIFARASNLLLVVLLVAIASIPISTLLVNPFEDINLGVTYTGPSWDTFRGNLMPHFTRGADGSQLKGKENFQDLFGILFPATAGIFAGASMSGSLKDPSKSIPRGTISGLILTFLAYAIVILSLSATVSRPTFFRNINVVQDVNGSGGLILLGEFAASFFSVLMGELGAANILQAIARDQIVPGLHYFGYGTKLNDEPIFAILVTHLLSQLTLFSDINQIASLVTMAYLMTFLVVNLACFLLKISSAPNFRPSFHYFRWWTAAGGVILSLGTMFFVDGVYATACLGILIVLFILIHFTTTPKSWGDVSQGLIYHQVRKYLLRLRQDHVKFWRPQILLLINDPRRSYKLIQFCNSLKKGSLFILGHVIVTTDFTGSVEEARKQQQNWKSYIDFSRIKAFINVAISPGLEWGSRNIILSAGLGSMRPNIVVIGFYNLSEFRASQPSSSLPTSRPSTPRPSKRTRSIKEDERFQGVLPTDTNRPEKAVGPMDYMTVLEDMLLRLRTNVAIAYNFQDLDLPPSRGSTVSSIVSSLAFWSSPAVNESDKQYIDLWPIQMTAEIQGENNTSYFTTNFDTYALILQLGCILHTVPSWKESFRLRVIVFVEYEADVKEERGRVRDLLTNLRIEAVIKVVWLASGKLKTYEILVNGADEGPGIPEAMEELDQALQGEDWWTEMRDQRDGYSDGTGLHRSFSGTNLSEAYTTGSAATSGFNPSGRLGRALLRGAHRRRSIGNLSHLGLNFTMQTQRLDPSFVQDFADNTVESSSSDESSDESIVEGVRGLPSPPDVFDDNDYADGTSQDIYSTQELGSAQHGGLQFTGVTFRDMSSDDTADHHDRPLSRDPNSLALPRLPEEDADSVVPQRAASERTRSSSPERKDTDNNPPRKKKAKRPPAIRHYSMPRLSSSLMPQTQITRDEGPGPSIMFRMPSPPTRPGRSTNRSIYDPPSQIDSPQGRARTGSEASDTRGGRRASMSRETSASGFPSLQSQSLGFNTLPSRAQHIILNELMRQHSGGHDTAVVFTTLPAPTPDTCDSEMESLKYLADLEVLCHDLPPCLLVHSNSCTVTMNL